MTNHEQAVDSTIGRAKVADLDEIPDGGSKIVTVQGRAIALFRFKGQYFAIANNCLHRGGPLGEGEVKNYEVTCPWHGWRYSLMDGALSLIPTLKVKTYPVKPSPEGVFIEIG
ncbi:MAG TPA: Rieske (2Fe-2S) protein [Candidatus Bathyarchaeia archaeon]|nr:Rieske (2Fe-2S) protein [Candidatus Bathyarchaeia archaeon]